MKSGQLFHKGNKYGNRSNSGVIALPSVIIISLLVLIAGIGVASSSFFENLMSFGDFEGKIALSIAEAGAEDAFERIVRNKNCNNGGTPTCDSYLLNFSNGSASIAVSGAGGAKTITSIGTVKNKQKKIQAIISVDANNKATQTSWQEIID